MTYAETLAYAHGAGRTPQALAVQRREGAQDGRRAACVPYAPYNFSAAVSIRRMSPQDTRETAYWNSYALAFVLARRSHGVTGKAVYFTPTAFVVP